MTDELKICDRCGSLLEQGAVRIVVSAAEETDSDEIPALNACRECAKSFSRWIDRGQVRSKKAKKKIVSRVERKSPRRNWVRRKRDLIALAAVILFCLMFYFYISKNFSSVSDPG